MAMSLGAKSLQDGLAEALSERPPTKEEVRQASEAVRALAPALTQEGLPMTVAHDGDELTVALSPALGQLVLDVLTHVAKGEMVTVVPYGAELSTKEAADLLNVSRPFLIKLLERGEIGFHRVGSHRRIEAEELLRYKKMRDSQRREAMKELQRLGQEFDAA